MKNEPKRDEAKPREGELSPEEMEQVSGGFTGGVQTRGMNHCRNCGYRFPGPRSLPCPRCGSNDTEINR